MAKERLPMRKIKEILRLRWHQGLSVRDSAASAGVSTGVIDKTVCRARAAGLTWECADALPEEELEARLYGRGPKAPGAERPRPDPVYMHAELQRKGVTLEVLHLEYLEEHPDGYRYTAFCDVYRRWLALKPVAMRQTHKAGEKTFIDYSGKKPHVIDPHTGEVIEVELFVASLGASHYIFAEATRTQRIGDFIGSHVRMAEFFGGVTTVHVPDQLKSAVTRPCRYEPGIARGYAEWARHYGTAIVPARPRKPKDKAKVEVAVQVAQRWILARLRNETFFSLATLNARIRELLTELNERPMRGYGGATRRARFESLDRPALRPLPDIPFEVSDWCSPRVSRDYHVEVQKHWYSVPYNLVGEQLDARITASTVELFFRGRRVAAHARSHEPYKHTTDPGHMPPKHRYVQSGVDTVLAWARSVGPMTTLLVERIVDASPIREQGFRSARGLQRVGDKHGPERTEAACAKALAFGARSYKPVERILRLGRERTLSDELGANGPGITHENVRGPDYYTH